jgi:hypothetical protein
VRLRDLPMPLATSITKTTRPSPSLITKTPSFERVSGAWTSGAGPSGAILTLVAPDICRNRRAAHTFLHLAIQPGCARASQLPCTAATQHILFAKANENSRRKHCRQKDLRLGQSKRVCHSWRVKGAGCKMR